MHQSYDTIIIGLGAAGTTAASILVKAGKRVLALEAQNRVGGRVHTVPFGDGLVELGAEWFYGLGGSRVYEIAVQNNMSLVQQHYELKAESLPEDIVKRKCTELLRKFIGKNITIPDPTDMIRSSYTFDNLFLVENIENKTLEARTALGAPLRDLAARPCVLFAGEATDLTHFGSVHLVILVIRALGAPSSKV